MIAFLAGTGWVLSCAKVLAASLLTNPTRRRAVTPCGPVWASQVFITKEYTPTSNISEKGNIWPAWENAIMPAARLAIAACQNKEIVGFVIMCTSAKCSKVLTCGLHQCWGTLTKVYKNKICARSNVFLNEKRTWITAARRVALHLCQNQNSILAKHVRHK